MILELLKLKTVVTDTLIKRGEAKLHKRYAHRDKLNHQIGLVQSCAPKSLTIEDVQELLSKNSGVTLQIDGKEVKVISSSRTAVVEESTAVVSASSTVAEVVAAEDGTEAELVVETIVETIEFAEPSDEMLSEINSAFDTTFTLKEVEEIIASVSAPKKVVTVDAEDLPDMNRTMGVSNMIIRRPGSNVPIISGTFISSSMFSGCGDDECTDCGDAMDEESKIVLNYIDDSMEDRQVMTIELERGLSVTLSL